jgi:hypothetical protein
MSSSLPSTSTTITTTNDGKKSAKASSSLEEKSLAEGGPRIRFQTNHIGHYVCQHENKWKPLAEALKLSEESGAAPVLPDGKIGGNGAILLSSSNNEKGGILVSRSGRLANTDFDASDFVKVTRFDAESWTADFYAQDDSIFPSSDTPLLWTALKVAPTRFQWKQQPRFILHGHSCATQEEADQRGIPCSPVETLFSTPPDLKALLDLFHSYPYPQHQVYVRKNHGFFLLAQDQDEAIRVFDQYRLGGTQPRQQILLQNRLSIDTIIKDDKD